MREPTLDEIRSEEHSQIEELQHVIAADRDNPNLTKQEHLSRSMHRLCNEIRSLAELEAVISGSDTDNTIDDLRGGCLREFLTNLPEVLDSATIRVAHTRVRLWESLFVNHGT